MGYRCATCGEHHEDLPDLGMDYPAQYWDVPEEERAARVDVTEDTCIIDDEHFFIRGVIELPIHDHPESFGFGVWVSQKKENFYTYVENFNSADIGPFFGWLCNSITYYDEETLLLKTLAHFMGGSARPRIEVEPTEHPLSVDQRVGISLFKAWEIVHYYLDADEADA